MLKKLLQSVREYKKPSLLAPFYVTLEVIMEVLIPFFMADIIDKGISKEDMSNINKTGLFLLIAAAMSLSFGALSGKYAAEASAGFAKNLRKDMFANIQNFSFSNIDKFSPASLVTRLTTDITNVQNAYQMVIRILIRGPLMLIFALAMSIHINFKLSLIFFIAIPILGIGLWGIAIKAHPYFDIVFKKYDILNNAVQENLNAIRVVKAYVREKFEYNKFFKISADVYHKFKFAEKIIAFNSPLMQFSMYTTILLLSWLGAKMITVGSLTTGLLTSMIVYATQILASLMMLSMVFVMIIMAETSAKRIVEVLEEKSTLNNIENPIYTISDGSIEFDNVSFSYIDDSNKLVLKNLNFSIKSGETVGIIGGTGSAKTTLVQLIPRLYDVTKGVIKVGGIDIRNYDLDTLRKEVAMVLQKNMLFSGTIKENLKWGNPEASDEDLIKYCQYAQAHEFIKNFSEGYDTMLEQGGSNLSGGQKQRICIARAMLKNPKILILDDSTSAVDTKTDTLIRKAFRENIPNTTKLIITQRISSIQEADKIILLDKGEISAIGTHDILMKNSKSYADLYYSQNKGGTK